MIVIERIDPKTGEVVPGWEPRRDTDGFYILAKPRASRNRNKDTNVVKTDDEAKVVALLNRRYSIRMQQAVGSDSLLGSASVRVTVR
jgi:hypothetical protein